MRISDWSSDVCSSDLFLQPKFGNRHGLVAGATGTGKTVTLTTIAEGFSRIGVPVFMADVKGDVAGLAAAGTLNEKLQARIDEIGIDGYTSEASPVIFWDLYGKLGHPVRTTVSEVGPTLLARMLELNDTQSGVLEIVFAVADDNGWLLLDLDDLRSLLGHAAEARDVLAVLTGDPDAPMDLRDRACILAGVILEIGEVALAGTGRALAEQTLADGSAWKKFQRICDAQGGMRTPPTARLKIGRAHV